MYFSTESIALLIDSRLHAMIITTIGPTDDSLIVLSLVACVTAFDTGTIF